MNKKLTTLKGGKTINYKTLLLLLLFCIGCEKQDAIFHDEIEFVIEPGLEQDTNGYYHLPLNPEKLQTLHRISGHVYCDGEPLEVVRFTWESSHYWVLNDTVGYIVQQGLTDDLVYVNYDTTYITGFSNFTVPTVNCCSYSNANGEVNTMFAPTRTMKLDTVVVSVECEFLREEIKIVLD